MTATLCTQTTSSVFKGIIYPLSHPETHTPLQIYCDLIFILFRRLLHVLGGSTAELLTPIPYIYCGFIDKRLNNEGMLISLKLGTIFISHIVLFYTLKDLYLFFIANPDF